MGAERCVGGLGHMEGRRPQYWEPIVEGASGDHSEHSQLGSLFQNSKILVTVRYPTEYALAHRVGHAWRMLSVVLPVPVHMVPIEYYCTADISVDYSIILHV